MEVIIEEKVAKNQVIISDVSCTCAKEALSDCNSTGGIIKLRAFRREKKVYLNQTLRAGGLSEEHRAALLEEKSEIEGIIDGLVAQQKHLQGDLVEQKALIEVMSALSIIRENKTKLEVPSAASIKVSL